MNPSRPGRRGRLSAFWRMVLILPLMLMCVVSPGARSLAAAPELLAGRYQLPGQAVFCQLQPLGDGAWQLGLWQGSAPKPGALALAARLLPQAGGEPDQARTRLAGDWQALPGSCCPGQGRLAIEALSPESFIFTHFSPTHDGPSWPPDAEQVWRRVADAPPPEPAHLLAGAWRVQLWYTDLLPQNAPADAQEGLLDLSPRESGVQGSWAGLPGRARLEPTAQGVAFAYQDPQARFDIKADLRALAGGLAYEGRFLSTLGEGHLVLLRQGLPAQPPDSPLAGEGQLSGLWVDRRTGSDFVRIKGSAQSFQFTAHGGDRQRPRYLSHGQARASGPGVLEGQAQDDKDFCCGNQGRLSFKILGPGRLQAQALWWPKNQPDPGKPLEEPYLLELARPTSISPAADNGDQWPEVFQPQPGLMPTRAGAVRVRFNWQPSAPGQTATLFGQGGYGQELELFIDSQGRLCGRVATASGLVTAQAAGPVSPRHDHEAWLIYQAGKDLRVILDDQPVARAPLPQPWTGSRAPYLVGASRWPLRDFEGAITSAELWAEPPDPLSPGPPSLTLNLSEQGEEEPPAASTPAAEATVALTRLFNPNKMRHAYAVDPQRIKELQAQGYIVQGPVGRLWRSPQAGGRDLLAFRDPKNGDILLQTQDQAPAGHEASGSWGQVLEQAKAGTQPLYQLEAVWDDSLRGQAPARDVLYTSRADLLPKLQEQGYGPPRLIGHLAREAEPTPTPPLTFSWGGVWGGEGWGRFIIAAKGKDLHLFWYYGDINGPRYHARLTPSADGRSAQGLAVGQPGPEATYYRLELALDPQASQGPRLRLKSWRLAAPLDDGRLVSFQKPQANESLLSKTAQAPPAEEASILEHLSNDAASDPQAQYKAALEQARRQNRLEER